MNCLRHQHRLAAFLCALAGAIAFAGEPDDTLRRANIKFTRDGNGKIVAVELPDRADDIHIRAILNIPTITEIRAPRCIALFDTFEKLRTLPALSAISLDAIEDANDYVACLRRVTQLQSISLAGSSLSNHGLNDLCTDHPHLRELNISATRVTVTGLKPLSKLLSLEVLQMDRIRQELDSASSDTPRSEFGYVANLPSLKRLRVSGVNIRDEHLKALACNCRLVAFDFPETDLEDGCDLVYFQSCSPELKLNRLARNWDG